MDGGCLVSDILTPTGVILPKVEPGSPEWLKRMSASKIAAVLGLSPFESKFSLYHRMTGLISDDGNDATRRGHYLEPAIAAWFADQRPDLAITETGTWVHGERDWQTATPDRLATHTNGHVECVECKSAADDAGWGPDGSDEIPVYYRAQVIWQLDTLGLRTCHVAVILPFLEFRSYVVQYDAGEAQLMRDAALEFLDDVNHRRRPDIDTHSATYQVVRELHPGIEPEEVDVPDTIAVPYLDALAACKDAEDEKRRTGALLLDHMGPAKDAYYDGKRIASRQVKSAAGAVPYLVAAKNVVGHFRNAA